MIKKNTKRKKITIFILNSFLTLFVPFLLSSCTPIKVEDIATNLLPNIWIFISHLIAFIVLLIVITFLVWKPTKKFLTKKKSLINKTLDDAKKTSDEANNNLNISKQSKINAIEEANMILKNAHNNASKIIGHAKDDAKKEALKIIERTNFYLEHKEKIMKNNYQQNVIRTALNIVENVFSDEKNDKNKQKYINHILNKIKKDFKKNAK